MSENSKGRKTSLAGNGERARILFAAARSEVQSDGDGPVDQPADLGPSFEIGHSGIGGVAERLGPSIRTWDFSQTDTMELERDREGERERRGRAHV